jgi:hypothetical protein
LPVICAPEDFRDQKATLLATTEHKIFSGVDINSLAFRGYNALVARPEAVALAVDSYTDLPMIISGDFGRGKVLALAFANVQEGKLAFDLLLLNALQLLAPNAFSKAESMFFLMLGGLSSVSVLVTIYLVHWKRRQ